MEARRRTIDAGSIQNATYLASSHVDGIRQRLGRFDADEKKAERLEKQQCKVCFYMAGRLGGAAMTKAQCGLCDNVKLFSSTCVDILCVDCARKAKLCVHCGGDVDMKNRRNRVLPAKTATIDKHPFQE